MMKGVLAALLLFPAWCARVRHEHKLDLHVANQRTSTMAGKTLAGRYRLLEVMESGRKGPEEREVGKFPWGNVKGSPLSSEEFAAPTELGKGAFGDTWKAMDTKRNVPVAVKIFYQRKDYITKGVLAQDEKVKEAVEENDGECKLVQNMESQASKHPEGKDNICQCLESHAMDQVADDDVSFLVLELCGTDLEKKLQQQVASPVGDEEWLTKVRKWMKGLLEGIEFMSTLDPPLMHLDLKLNNVVVTDADEAKIIDFGLTLPVTDYKCKMTTPRFAPPEWYLSYGSCKGYTAENAWAYDVWTIGSIYYNLLCKEPNGNTDFASEHLMEGGKAEGKYFEHCQDGTPGYGKPEDWAVIKGALANLKDRLSPEALLQKLPA